jgi:uncharacterized RDD family membrane protein YckC
LRPTPNSTNPVDTNLQFAGFWLRFFAAFIDGLLLAVVSAIILQIILLLMHAVRGTTVIYPFGAQAVMAAFVIGRILTPFYYVIMESSTRQGTIGKTIVGIKVGDARGSRISAANALGRLVAKVVSNMILFGGYIMIAFTRNKQGLHDMIANTYVFRAADANSGS